MPRSVGLFDSPDTFALDWKGLYQEHAPRLRRIAERRVGTAQAEDVVQDAFMRAYRNHASFDPSLPIGAWLSSITLYSSTDLLRRRSVRPEELVDDEDDGGALPWLVEDEFDNAVRKMGIEAAFDSLNHRQRRVLKRLEVDGWSQEEVAEVEQISTDAVKSLAARARRTFRDAYSTFAERMGVFGGATIGPAVLRLRNRVQRLHGSVSEHIGAVAAAAATVTVVAIATVPSVRPSATSAVEHLAPTEAPAAPTSTVAGHSEQAAASGSSVGQAPTGAGERRATARQSTTTVSPSPEAEVEQHREVQAQARVQSNGHRGEAMFESSVGEEGSETRTWAGLAIHDCSAGYTTTLKCHAIEVANEGPKAPTE